MPTCREKTDEARHAIGRYDFAVAESALAEASRLDPSDGEPHFLTATIRRTDGDDEGEEAAYRAAVAADPGHDDAAYHLGQLLHDSGRTAEALAVLGALAARDDDAPAVLNARNVSAWIRDGRLAPRPRPTPAFRPTRPLAGQSVTFAPSPHGGLGDDILAARITAVAARRGAVVTLACRPSLAPLFRSIPGVSALVPVDPDVDPDPRGFTGYAEALFGIAAGPGLVPYLGADLSRADRWSGRLDTGRFRVGVVWCCSAGPGCARSAPLAAFAPLAAVGGVDLIALQFGPALADVASVPFPVVELPGLDDDRSAMFLDTAAVASRLDLIVTVDTSVAHLCGALGLRTWVAMPTPAHATELSTENYPTVRVFRQDSPGAWRPVFDRMAEELREEVNV